MRHDVRPCSSAAELREAVRPIWHYFGRSGPADDQFERFARVLPAERMIGAWEDGHAVGGAGAFAYELAVPGGRVRAAGITAVGVLPTHRRRGILRSMMRAQLDQCHERGESVAYLWATEDTLYGRFGYGIGSFSAEVELPRDRSSYYAAAAPVGRARLVSLRDAELLIAPVYEQVAIETPGMFKRWSEWWQARVLNDPEARRGGAGELMCLVLEQDGRPAAYALYRMNWGSDRGAPTGAVDVVEAVGNSPATTHAIWRCLLDMDWTARIKARLLPVDHPLLLLVAEPRRLRFNFRDGLWVRLVDVGAALAARSLAAPGTVVIEVVDEFCPWNAGRWRVGDGCVERTESAPDLRCDVTALGSVYLGGFTWTRLARALRAEELRPGALTQADALFRTNTAPWCVEIF